MSQVYQSRSVLRENGIKGGALQVRETQGVAEEVAGEEETKAARTEGAITESDQGSKKRRGRKGDRLDENLNHEAVLFYRETFRLCPNFGRRKDIVSTVTDINLWKTVLTEWKERKWNPLKVNWMLSEYERREKSTERPTNGNGRSDQRISEAQTVPFRVSEWRQGSLSCLRERAGVRFRASSKTLEEVVTEALRQNNRLEAEVKE